MKPVTFEEYFKEMRSITMEQFTQIVTILGLQHDDILITKDLVATFLNKKDCVTCVATGDVFKHTIDGKENTYVVIGSFPTIECCVIRKVV